MYMKIYNNNTGLESALILAPLPIVPVMRGGISNDIEKDWWKV